MLTRQEGLQEHFWLDQGHTGVDGMGTFVSDLKTVLCSVFVGTPSLLVCSVSVNVHYAFAASVCDLQQLLSFSKGKT